jgi:hypothetical protein
MQVDKVDVEIALVDGMVEELDGLQALRIRHITPAVAVEQVILELEEQLYRIE